MRTLEQAQLEYNQNSPIFGDLVFKINLLTARKDKIEATMLKLEDECTNFMIVKQQEEAAKAKQKEKGLNKNDNKKEV